MAKVYIVNKGAHDHSDAQRFGELVYLSEGAINRYSTNLMYRNFTAILLKSDKEDYILPTGLTIMSNIACAIFAVLHRRLNLLIYKASRSGGPGRYVQRSMILDSGGDFSTNDKGQATYKGKVIGKEKRNAKNNQSDAGA